MGELISVMILAVLALFGAYCLVRLFWESRYTPKGMQISLTLLSRDDVRALPDLLLEVFSRLSVPKEPLLVLVPTSLYEDPAVQEELDAFLIGYDAELLVFTESEEDTPSM